MAAPILEARAISKAFTDPVRIEVLKDISFQINKGEFVSVVGKSGCGKSTLLYILSTMDTDYTGELMIEGEPMAGKTEKELAAVRNEKIGFVFQFHYLLNEFSVAKNIMLPGLKLGILPEEALYEKARKLLRLLDMEKLIDKPSYQLSGGEKQRVAIARAMINDPVIIMGDEPTGNLDSRNSGTVFDIFQELVTNFQQTLLIVTHDNAFAERTQRIIHMDDGKIVR